jgi:tripartite-type tricarboxylate transporter receptor subunit TctC
LKVSLNVTLTVILSIVLWNSANAEDYPSKPIKIIVPFPAGGSADISTRKIASMASAKLGQQVIVENRPGAAGNIGTAIAAKAAPDGYTLAYTVLTTMAVNPHVYSNAGYQALDDFAPIVTTYKGQALLVVPAASPIGSVADLIAAAKAQPGKLSYPSGGIGSPHHLFVERLKQLAGIDLAHVPYKGDGQYMPELLAGQLHVAINFPAASLPHIKAGKLRVLAVTSNQRSKAFPPVPTLAEAGVAGYNETLWAGFAAPARTPPERIRKLNGVLREVLRSPEFVAYLDTLGYEPVADTPEQATALIRSDHERYGKIVKELGLRVE